MKEKKKEKLILVKLDSKYCDYLRQFDSKVPYNYAKKELRPFVGVLFEIEECLYFAPLSSPKPKHINMNPTQDFIKLDGGKLGAVNINNMIPVTEKNIIEIDFENDELLKNDRNYTKLLKKQLYWLERNDEQLYKKSRYIYTKYLDKTLNAKIAKRCCNFELLEEKCREYNRVLKEVR